MEHVRLGDTGLQVSRLCLGTRDFGARADEAQSVELLDRAAELGIDFIDLADVYPVPPSPQTWGRSEEIVGRWLKGRRDNVVVATKVGNPMGTGPNDRGGGRRHVIAGCEASLRRLATDRIDVLYLHYPDPLTPIEETLDALEYLRSSGRILYWGLSNFAAWQMAMALLRAGEPLRVALTSLQLRYNLLHREPERELVPLCASTGVGLLPYNPLATGMLTGRYTRDSPPPPGSRFAEGRYGERYRAYYWSDPMFDVVERLAELARAESLSSAGLALAWLLARPGVGSVIMGASTVAQLEDCVQASGRAVSPAALAELDSISERFR